MCLYTYTQAKRKKERKTSNQPRGSITQVHGIDAKKVLKHGHYSAKARIITSHLAQHYSN